MGLHCIKRGTSQDSEKKEKKKKMKKTSRLRLTVAARMQLRDRLRQERSSLHARDDHDHRGGNEIRFQVTMTKEGRIVDPEASEIMPTNR